LGSLCRIEFSYVVFLLKVYKTITEEMMRHGSFLQKGKLEAKKEGIINFCWEFNLSSEEIVKVFKV
jgi:hypothetical protein